MAIKVLVCKDFSRSFNLLLYVMMEPLVPNADMAIATSVRFEPYKMGKYSSPLITLDSSAAQSLMDNLWDCGVRPTEGSGSAGSFAAQAAHLADMRRLVEVAHKVKL